MNALVISLVVLLWFALAYRFYGGYLEKTLVRPDRDAPTPSHRLEDGVDYRPQQKALSVGQPLRLHRRSRPHHRPHRGGFLFRLGAHPFVGGGGSGVHGRGARLPCAS